MNESFTLLVVEDDPGHAALVQRSLRRAGVSNEILHFDDGEKVLDFLFGEGAERVRDPDASYLMLLDIRMPKVDGLEVLRRIKMDDELADLPILMLTTTQEPEEVEACHALGCSSYLTKPVTYRDFLEAVRKIGLSPLLDGGPPAPEGVEAPR